MNRKFLALLCLMILSGCGSFKGQSSGASRTSNLTQAPVNPQQSNGSDLKCSIQIRGEKFQVFEGGVLDSEYSLPQMAPIRIQSLVAQHRCRSSDNWKGQHCEINQVGENFEISIDGKVFSEAETQAFADLYIKWATEAGYCQQ